MAASEARSRVRRRSLMSIPRSLTITASLLGFLASTVTGQATARAPRDIHAGAWTYFGDPRSIAHGNRIFTGMVDMDRRIVVEQFDRRTGRSSIAYLHQNSELDDHDNPSVVFWRRKVYAFYTPHSGRFYPHDRRTGMRYRVSRAPYDLRQG